MIQSVRVFEVKQELTDDDLDLFLKLSQDNICFYRFIGGNPSETDALMKQLYRIKERQIVLFGIFRFPFRFEGKKRIQTAIEQYYTMKDICDCMIYFNSDGMMDMLDEGTSIYEAKKLFDQFEEAPINAVKDMLKQSGDINIDIQDMKNFINNNDKTLFIRTFEGQTFDEPLKYMISAPYLPTDFADGKQLMVNIGYSKEVDMSAYQQISLRLNDLFHKAEIFKMGSYLLDEPGCILKITLLVNGIDDPYARPEQMSKTVMTRMWLQRKFEQLTYKTKVSKRFPALLNNRTNESLKKEQ